MGKKLWSRKFPKKKELWKPFIKEVTIGKKWQCFGCAHDFDPGTKAYLFTTRKDIAEYYATMGPDADKSRPDVRRSCKSCLDDTLLRETQEEYEANAPEGFDDTY